MRPFPGPGRRRVTLRARLTLAYGALLTLVALTLIALLYGFMRYVPVYSETMESPGAPSRGTAGVGAGWKSPAKSLAIRGRCDEDRSLAGLLSEIRWLLTSTADPGPQSFVCRSADGADAGADTWVTTFQVTTKEDFLRELLLFSAVALAVLLLIALFLGWIVAGRMLAPLQRVTATARGIAGSTLHERITPTGPKDELRELAETFNDMLERLDRSFDAQRRFASNASHELKTPLTGMRAILQVALAAPEEYRLQDVGPKLLTLTTRSADILSALLTLARADQGGIGRRETALEGVVRETAAQHRAQARELGVALTVDAAPARVTGNPVLLGQLTANLVSNAIRHNHAGGTAEVRVERDPGQGPVRLVVRNSGRRFSRKEIDMMREPFHRLDTRQAGRAGRGPTGHGLGLAVAESIAQAHAGELHIASPPEGGLEVTVTLPLADRGEQAPSRLVLTTKRSKE
ncbi:HAMP domain-containing sensor histidine kinase [Streptomyces massasporeus]|uniref:sensor histidine kinase n=1 Tax=Streptomyces massasporeus TaxID=67324 RepID=UPI0033E9D94B